MAELEEPKETYKLAFVIRDDGSYGGWRTELLVEEIKGEIEAKFLLCNYCRGVLRDACIYKKDSKHEVACSLCIPKDVEKQNASMNRETINEKKAHCPLKSKGCDWENELSKLPHHLEECELFPVACPYFQSGCEVEILRRNLEQHEKDDMHKHMKLTMNNMQSRVSEQEKENTQLITKIVQLEKDNEELKKSYLELKSPLTLISNFILKRTLVWNISGIKNKISQKEITLSDPFYVGLYKFQGYVQWVSNDNYVGIFLPIMKGELDVTLKWPIRYKSCILVLNQLDSKGSYVRKLEITEEDLKNNPECFNKPSTEQNMALGTPELISHADLLQEKYSKDDSIVLLIFVELISSP